MCRKCIAAYFLILDRSPPDFTQCYAKYDEYEYTVGSTFIFKVRNFTDIAICDIAFYVTYEIESIGDHGIFFNF